MILTQLGILLISSYGCAVRSRQDLSAFRVVRHERSYFVYPPGQHAAAGAPDRAVVDVSEFGAAQPGAECATGDALVELDRGAKHGRTVARVRLDWKAADDAVPTAEENRADRLRLAFEQLETNGCLRPEGGRKAAFRAAGNLPLPFAELLPYQYGFIRGGSVIDLMPGTRLKIQQAFFRPDAGPSPSLRDYTGTTTSYYDVADSADAIVLTLGDFESDVPPGSPARQARSPILGHAPRKARYFRLVFLGLIVEGNTARKSVLISANSFRELEAIAQAALANPEFPCAGNPLRSTGSCFEFGGAVSTEVELKITVDGAPRFVSIGTALRALAPAAAEDIDSGAQSEIRLVRHYGGKKAHVRLDWKDSGALELPLLAGDELSWR